MRDYIGEAQRDYLVEQVRLLNLRVARLEAVVASYPRRDSEGGILKPMSGWRTAPVNGVWRLENADFHGHRLTVYRSSTGKYRAYLNGRMLGLWRTKETAMAAAEWATLAPGAHPPAPSHGKADNVVPLKAKA